MVHAFLVHTVGTSPTILHRTIYSSQYVVFQNELGEVSPVHQGTIPDNEFKTLQAATLEKVAEYTNSEINFYRSMNEKHIYEEAELNNDHLPFETGFIRLPAGEYFENEKIAVWTCVKHCAFVLISEKHENRALAESVLKLLVKYLEDHLHFINQPVDVMLKSEVVSTVVSHVIPSGQLGFMNHRVIRKIDKDLEVLLGMKL